MMFVVLTLTMVVASMAGGLALGSQSERQIAAAHRRAVQLGYTSESAAAVVVSLIEAQSLWTDMPGTFVTGPLTVTPDLVARTSALNQSLAGRFPLGADTPVWRVVAASSHQGIVSAVWIADDPGDGDNDATRDSNGRLMVHAEARASSGALRSVDVHLERRDAVTRRLSWQEVW